jgi:hypothetical protein
MDWGILLGVVGVFGIPLALAILGLTMAATTHGEFRFVRACFVAAGVVSAATVFLLQWNYPEGPPIMRIVIVALAGALIFGGVSAALDWVKHKEVAAIPESKASPQSQGIKSGLEQLFIESDGFWRRLISMPKNISDDDYKKLQDEIDNWSLRLEKYIAEQLGPLARARMLQIPEHIQQFGADSSYPAKISEDRAHTMAALNITRNQLLQLIDSSPK